MRPLLALLLVIGPTLGCAESRMLPGDDAGPGGDAATCGGGSPLVCVSTCGSDAGRAPICVEGAWVCPPGTVDLATCPPTCWGPPPGPDCVCEGTTWSCPSGECPPGLDPWGPPVACALEGATCSRGGGSACGGGMWCECRGGTWSCAVAEPDPVCWCGRQPSPGDPCSEEGASCGECCPVPGGTGWPAMTCVGGAWEHAGCPELVCPPFECPADTRGQIGEPCSAEGAICGDACCGTAITCAGGAWIPGPEADCAACTQFPCGDGFCRAGEICEQRCGPDGGARFVCTAREGCEDCSCLPLEPEQDCTMIDGHPHVRVPGCI